MNGTKRMKVLIACEFSGIVRDAFRKLGHDAYSCDIIDSEPFSDYHIKEDVIRIFGAGWDLMIAHPPCTYLAVSGARWFKEKQKERWQSIKFFMSLVESPVNKWCIENPVGIMSTIYRKPDQYIQPWQFGHGETKKTGLWLKGLPLLKPTNIFEGREQRIWKMSPSKDRGKLRSITYQGIADAMAEQWG